MGHEQVVPAASRTLLPALARIPGHLLWRANARVQVLLDQELPEGIDIHAYAVLLALADGTPRSQQSLADSIAVSRTTMVRVAAELAEQGLVERVRNPADRRSYALTRTRAAAGAVRRWRPHVARLEAAVVRPFTPGGAGRAAGAAARDHPRGPRPGCSRAAARQRRLPADPDALPDAPRVRRRTRAVAAGAAALRGAHRAASDRPGAAVGAGPRTGGERRQRRPDGRRPGAPWAGRAAAPAPPTGARRCCTCCPMRSGCWRRRREIAGPLVGNRLRPAQQEADGPSRGAAGAPRDRRVTPRIRR